MSTNAERQRRYRQKLSESGEAEIRGLTAPSSEHKEIKALVRANQCPYCKAELFKPKAKKGKKC